MDDNHSLDDARMNEISQQESYNEYTRVTQILSPFNGLTHVPKNIIDNAATRGSLVHEACEAIVKGIGLWNLPEDVQGYVDSFQKWWSLGHKVLAIEKRFFCSELMITGKVDYIIQGREAAIILDLKTSYKPSKTWPLQGSAYAYLARKDGYDIKGIHFLQLRRDGQEPYLYVYDDNFDLFKKCLDIYRHFFEVKHGK